MEQIEHVRQRGIALNSQSALSAFDPMLGSDLNARRFTLPGLRSRPEDIEPNLQFELEQFEQRTSHHVTFNKEAREKFLQFVLSATSTWTRNFRDLNAAVVRMATLAQGGRISTAIVEEEIERLNISWASLEDQEAEEILSQFLSRDQLADIDLFDSRAKKTSTNDADRLRKYLGRFGIEWAQLERA
jgi:transcriptional regulatory protein RtcR